MKRRGGADGSGKKRAKDDGAGGGTSSEQLVELLRENRRLREELESLKDSKFDLELRSKDAERKLVLQNEMIKRYRKKLILVFESNAVMKDDSDGDANEAKHKASKDANANGASKKRRPNRTGAQTSSDSSSSVGPPEDSDNS
mmetsp:Transcript_398/g.1361  ORF Transcript_398/g.1361 Transcript_398/m.1361 type:complete len:143 (+) Transcript_398:65-493(+)|eukprot:CAMPEP_0198722618 /NCGR_PEP_ID=MMETSP1475-20131203/280_1 /TAXON_ID= ORGANISM="Unidentified sp., Strain CCMP1999" /NCGR_SAMPLE_ID=MMETSP1475 /ASSEMBLY_ACC=CAM_ASM_001111 /LENGTH=142 /DNA_ID=CAMNT_0044483529 /DNA_START=33 /DNA_END=461 /DNA_ORIENTATION=-